MTAPTLADLIAFAVLSERRTIEKALEWAGVDAADRDDLVQDVVILAVDAQRGSLAWQHRASLVRWLHVVASRHALDYQGRAARRELPEAHPEDARTVPSAEDLYLMRETTRSAARSTTPERWRALRAWANGVHVADIARREGLTVPGVYSRIQAARVDIRAALRRDAHQVRP